MNSSATQHESNRRCQRMSRISGADSRRQSERSLRRSGRRTHEHLLYPRAARTRIMHSPLLLRGPHAMIEDYWMAKRNCREKVSEGCRTEASWREGCRPRTTMDDGCRKLTMMKTAYDTRGGLRCHRT